MYKRQVSARIARIDIEAQLHAITHCRIITDAESAGPFRRCLLYTSDAADERSSVDLGGRRIIKKKNTDIAIASEVIEMNVMY